jgi:hypothetical protein
MYFPRNWEFGSALSKLRTNFGGGVGLNPQPPPRVRQCMEPGYHVDANRRTDMTKQMDAFGERM